MPRPAPDTRWRTPLSNSEATTASRLRRLQPSVCVGSSHYAATETTNSYTGSDPNPLSRTTSRRGVDRDWPSPPPTSCYRRTGHRRHVTRVSSPVPGSGPARTDTLESPSPAESQNSPCPLTPPRAFVRLRPQCGSTTHGCRWVRQKPVPSSAAPASPRLCGGVGSRLGWPHKPTPTTPSTRVGASAGRLISCAKDGSVRSR
jgi:hypothetical protein